MGTKWNAADTSAYEALDRLLYREWDPIGVSESNGPDDEYRSYLSEFWRLVDSGAPEHAIADYLHKIERERITLETSAEHRLDVARKAACLLLAWRMPVRR